MANNYFRFKQFIIYQDKCAMKVTTDGCLFGAMAANAIKNQKSKIKNCLDIGIGTGLLSLMLAQKTTAVIDAVEIEEQSYLQAKENIEHSAWKERINIYHTDITTFNTDKKYDCIISNPPFFENDLKSIDEIKNKAKHDTSLTLTQLLKTIDSNLAKDGVFFLLLPYHRTAYFEQKAETFNLFAAEKILVKQTVKHNFFRSMMSFSREKVTVTISDIIIKDEEGNYTKEFAALLKDYYLEF